ncbi:hypothetical protein B0T18DRAFT_393810 [Schizothecium vesticola]|uniref:Ankyrin n=1 Tax=Schizothecium vesticola TaxID=314040 RepID=A0AA40EKQ4_9PEZI|nr:hypothetical protein B0T18DRAFT_393810 [Schizothecium vesticola]
MWLASKGLGQWSWQLEHAVDAKTPPSLFTALLTRIVAGRGLPPLASADSARLLCMAIRMHELILAYALPDDGADVNCRSDMGELPLSIFLKNTLLQTSANIQFLQALLDRGADPHLRCSTNIDERILNRVITLDLVDVLALILKKQNLPLASDPRASGGFYLHRAVTVTQSSGYSGYSGPDLGEVNEQDDTSFSALLRSLCRAPRFAWRYHRFIKPLVGPGVDINRCNNEGKSIADYLQQLMYPEYSAPETFLTRRLQIVEGQDGKKSLHFLPRPKWPCRTPHKVVE